MPVKIVKHIKKKLGQDILSMVRSLETLKTKYMEIQSDIKFTKSYKVDRLIPTFTNINLSIKSNSYKLKQRIVRIAMKKEMQNKHYEKKKFKKEIFAKYPVNLNKYSQRAFTCSKLTIKTLEQGVKYVQS